VVKKDGERWQGGTVWTLADGGNELKLSWELSLAKDASGDEAGEGFPL